MKHVLLSIALLSCAMGSAFADNALEAEINQAKAQKMSCEEQVKGLHKQVAELNERIARLESQLAVQNAEAKQRAIGEETEGSIALGMSA